MGTGVSIEIPEGHYGQVKPRSGLVLKKTVTTDAGVIDRDYTGELKVILVNRGKKAFVAETGERIAQLVLIKNAMPKVQEVKNLKKTDREASGFGLTGTTSVAGAHLLKQEQLEEININPELDEGQRQQVEELLWEF